MKKLRTRLRVEALEDRNLLNARVAGVGPVVLENFDSGLSRYQTQLRYSPSAVVEDLGDGDLYLKDTDGYDWMVRNDAEAQVRRGDVLTSWVRFNGVADGRSYLAFGTTPQADPGFLSTARTLSVVVAPNTNQLLIQQNSGYGHTTIGSIAQTFDADYWYLLAVFWGADGSVTGAVYDSDGATLINYVTATPTLAITSGGFGFRAFGGDKLIYDVVNYPQLIGGAGPAGVSTLQAFGASNGQHAPQNGSWLPARQAVNTNLGGESGGASVAGAIPLPFQYVATPGTGRDITLSAFSGASQIVRLGERVAIAAGNTSRNVGTRQVGWGPVVRGLGAGGASSIPPETPLLQQFMYRLRPGENAERLGESDTKNFFLATGVDGQFLRPGESDTYGSGLNGSQVYYSPVSQMNPVTGELPIKDWFGNRNDDNIVVFRSRTFADRAEHLLTVQVPDIDPAQNPEGTRWFVVGNLYVAGDQNLNNNSVWFEVRPTLGTSGNFTFPPVAFASGTCAAPVGTSTSSCYNILTLPGLVVPGVAAPAGVIGTSAATGESEDLTEAALALALPSAAPVVVSGATTAEEPSSDVVPQEAMQTGGAKNALATTTGSANDSATDEVFADGEPLFADPFAG